MRLRVPNFKLEEGFGSSVHLVELRQRKEGEGGRSAWEGSFVEGGCERGPGENLEVGGLQAGRARLYEISLRTRSKQKDASEELHKTDSLPTQRNPPFLPSFLPLPTTSPPLPPPSSIPISAAPSQTNPFQLTVCALVPGTLAISPLKALAKGEC